MCSFWCYSSIILVLFWIYHFCSAYFIYLVSCTISDRYFPFGYHNPNSSVPLRYLKILFTTNTCDSFGASWNHASYPTAFITSSLDVITYSRLPIIDLYCLWSVDFESSSLLNLQLVCMGVITGLQSSITNLFSISLIYLVWEIKFP